MSPVKTENTHTKANNEAPSQEGEAKEGKRLSFHIYLNLLKERKEGYYSAHFHPFLHAKFASRLQSCTWVEQSLHSHHYMREVHYRLTKCGLCKPQPLRLKTAPL